MKRRVLFRQNALSHDSDAGSEVEQARSTPAEVVFFHTHCLDYICNFVNKKLLEKQN